jgi:beta-phosphoglucomutase-like phosphatase (HAD superfamily)
MTVPVRPGVLFDVDGTLVDSNYLHALSWARALRDAGEWAPMNAIHRLVGMGGDQLVNELLGHGCPDAQAARPKHYEELKGDIVPFPDAAKLVRRIHGLGLGVVLATSAPQNELRFLRDLLDADDGIDAQTSADDVAVAKPDPEVFLTAVTAFGTLRRRDRLASGAWPWSRAGSVDMNSARPALSSCTET